MLTVSQQDQTPRRISRQGLAHPVSKSLGMFPPLVSVAELGNVIASLQDHPQGHKKRGVPIDARFEILEGVCLLKASRSQPRLMSVFMGVSGFSIFTLNRWDH